MKKVLLVLSFFLTLGACDTRTQDVQKPVDVYESFQSEMLKTVNTYPILPGSNEDSIDFNRFYPILKKSLFITYFSRIDMELRYSTPCGGCWSFEVIHLYNDSIHAIIPYTDHYYFWQLSSDSKSYQEKDIAEKLNFITDLNRAIKKFNIRSKYDFISELMTSILGFYSIDKYTLNKLKMKSLEMNTKVRGRDGNELQYLYSDGCRKDLLQSYEKVEAALVDGNPLVFSDGELIYFFDFQESGEVELEVLNKYCVYRLMI